MGTGRGDAQGAYYREDTVLSESPRPGLFGLTLRQTIVLALIAYACLTALVISKSFNSGESTVEVTWGGGSAAEKNVLRPDHEKAENVAAYDAEIFDSGSKSSGLALKSIDELGIVDDGESYPELRRRLYHSWVVFGMNYDEMTSKFKIFSYPADEHSFKGSSGTEEVSAKDIRHTDELFAYLLFQSDFITADAEQAHLLFLPLSTRSLENNAAIGPAQIGKFLNKYVQTLRDDYPYWWRTLGADHVLVNCREAKEDGSRNVLELKKNAIEVACSPLAGDGAQAFYPHKDVAMPLYEEAPARPAAGRDVDRAVRSTLAYYSGPTDSSSLYASLGVTWDIDSGFVFEDASEVEPAVHHERLSSSKFCLILGPRDYPQIVNALRFGCVPVLVSDGKLYDLPFQDILNWNQFSVVVSRRNLQKLESLLTAVDEQRYAIMQYLAREASKHLEWHNPPRDQDAFYMVLYDLWIRRHAIRYVRRDDL